MLRVEARHQLGDLLLDVELAVESGGCLALAGPSGAGKTSVLRIAAATATSTADSASAASKSVAKRS